MAAAVAVVLAVAAAIANVDAAAAPFCVSVADPASAAIICMCCFVARNNLNRSNKTPRHATLPIANCRYACTKAPSGPSILLMRLQDSEADPLQAPEMCSHLTSLF